MGRLIEGNCTALLFLVIPLLILSVGYPVFSQESESDYVTLRQFLEEIKGELLWNPVTRTGYIQKGNSSIQFKLDIPVAMTDFSENINIDPLVQREGVIYLTSRTRQLFIDHFSRNAAETAPRVTTILIDPGHGGKDPGAVMNHKGKGIDFYIEEKNVTLKVSLLLYEMLRNRFPMKRILLTRSDDRYLKLEERVELANSLIPGDNEAVIYVSIHCNASFNKSARGFEVWYLPPDYRRDLIDEESVDKNEKDIVPILNTLLEEEYTMESISLAQDILDGLEDRIGPITVNRGLKEESWFVVRNAKMPSVLLELGFISNREEAERLSSDDYLNKIASGIYNGIYMFIDRFEKSKGFTD